MSHLFKTRSGKGGTVKRMMITLHTVNLEVADPTASKRFYTDALGMIENPQRSDLPDFVYLESANCHLTLAKREHANGEPCSRTMELGFLVDDLATLRANLMEKNVDGFRPQKMDWGDVIEGHDPDGHRVIVYSLRQREG